MSNNNTMDNTSQIELFQKYCSLLKKQDFDNANTLFNKIDWFRFCKVGYHNVLKTVPVITEDLYYPFSVVGIVVVYGISILITSF